MLRRLRFSVILAVAVVVLAACSPSPTTSPGGGGSSPGTDSSPGADGGQDLSGTTVTVLGAFRDVEAERFDESVAAFEEETGVDVQYEGTGEFETLINTRVEAGDAPDAAFVPQPGLVNRFADHGNLVPLPESVVANIDANYGPGWKEIGTGADGNVYGVFHRVNVKGLVFYPRPAFEEAGYEVPETWEDLQALQDQMVADGTAPWCIGIESAEATGWVGTDWTEEIMLRTAGPDVYDQWVGHEIPFNDQTVIDALNMVGEIWLNDDYVSGGTDFIASTAFQDAPTPMFDDPPGCYLHNQGNFITGFFPEEVQEVLDEEVGIFTLPAINEEFGTPVMVGGDQLVMFEDRPEVVAFIEYLTTPAAGETWAQLGGALFPYSDQDLALYPSELERSIAQILVDADSARFDGSDAMPPEVGNGTFWAGIVDWVTGTPTEEVLQTIEDSWPTD